MNYQEQQPQHHNTHPIVAFETHAFYHEATRQIHGESFAVNLFHTSQLIPLEFARKKKPSGLKKDKGKLPNHIRHDQNAAIAVGTWKNKGRSKNR